MAADRAGGYVTDIDYVATYNGDLSPSAMAQVALWRGLAPPAGRPLRYLELGFGRGLSLNVHAASNDGAFWGIDIVADHVEAAAAMAQTAGSNLTVANQSIAEFAARGDLPDFDVIALHGVWSWISAANRALIVDLARRKLADGGYFYVTYNAMPGWGPLLPLREVMVALGRSAPDGSDTKTRIDTAMTMLQRLAAAGSGYLQANPLAANLLTELAGKEARYLAHEYFNADWQPMSFAAVADQLSAAGLTYAGPGQLIDHIDAVAVATAPLAVLNDIADPVARELARDFALNRQFRRDLWIKQPRRMPEPDLLRRWQDQAFVLLVPASQISLVLSTPLGSAELEPSVYVPVVQALAAEAYRPKPVTELAARLAPLPFGAVIAVLKMLMVSGQVAAALPAADRRARTDRLNRGLIAEAQRPGALSLVASPVIGGAIGISPLDGRMVAAVVDGAASPAAIADHVRAPLPGQSVMTPIGEDIIQRAQEFFSVRLPVLRALEIA